MPALEFFVKSLSLRSTCLDIWVFVFVFVCVRYAEVCEEQ